MGGITGNYVNVAEISVHLSWWLWTERLEPGASAIARTRMRCVCMKDTSRFHLSADTVTSTGCMNQKKENKQKSGCHHNDRSVSLGSVKAPSNGQMTLLTRASNSPQAHPRYSDPASVDLHAYRAALGLRCQVSLCKMHPTGALGFAGWWRLVS